MKHVLLFIGALFFVCSIQAQDIFKQHGFNKEPLTLSKGRYEEVFTNKEVVQSGSVLLNTKTNKVVKFLDEEDTLTVSFEAEYSSRWLSPDPMAEKYPQISPYVYCANNPLKFVDPTGMIIKGMTRQDAQDFRDDIYKVLADDKFANIRALIDVKGKTFNRIDADALSSAMDGLTLTDDERAYITIVTGAINSKAVYKVEYLNYSEDVSSSGSAAITKSFKDAGIPINSDVIWKASQVATQGGEGATVPIKNGTHSFIINGVPNAETTCRAVTSGHEVFGHGIPLVKGLSETANNSNAIRTDNLIRRLLGLPQRDGSNHRGYNQGQIINPYQLPITQ